MSAIEFIINLFATMVFSYAGCVNSLEFSTHSTLAVLINAALCSHGGGLIWRDMTLNFITHKTRTPSAMTSYDTWIAAFVAFVTFEYVRRKYIKVLPDKRNQMLIYSVIDYGGVGLFAYAGVNRAYSVYAIRSIVLLTYAGTFTAIGGGLLSLLFFRSKKTYRLINNTKYYLTAFTAALVATILKTCSIEDPYSAVLISIICTFVPVNEVFISVMLDESIIPMIIKNISIKNRYVISSRRLLPPKSLWKLHSTMIRYMYNPYQGIHLHSIIHIYRNTSLNEYQFVDAIC